MEKLDIAQCLARPENELLLKIMFCCNFDENIVTNQPDDDYGLFIRLYFDCRTGELNIDANILEESARKQLYQGYGEASLHFIPLVQAWINADAPAYHHWGETDLYSIERMESFGWGQWRKDAEAYIKREYAKHAPDGYFG